MYLIHHQTVNEGSFTVWDEYKLVPNSIWMSISRSHLHCVRLLGVFVVRDAEAQRVLGALHQHQSGALEQNNHRTTEP